MANEDERIALLLDYENLAIGARDGLGVAPFDFGPLADALAERGRVVVRRAYADWSAFDEDRRLMARAQVELIEIPQRIGGSRKNAADIKLAVDAIELAYERGFVTTFAIGTGDSDFTPLMHKLRELDKRVIGIGVQDSTSALLPPACDEFLFYDRLPGVEPTIEPRPRNRRRGAPKPVTGAPAPAETPAATSPPVVTPAPVEDPVDEPVVASTEERDVAALVGSTLTGLLRHSDGPVLASRLKRAILRKDPTFDESDHGFRGFGELLRHLDNQGVLILTSGSAQGDPEVGFPEDSPADADAFGLLVDVVRELAASGAAPQLSRLKNQLRKRMPDFDEKRYGFGSFLSFAKAARARDLLSMEWNDDAGDYLLRLPG
ncbi:NYN domain-containing protein [Pseudonocardia sp. KRD291]|uniref:NYN domain-containing protein n=1 Tax=Pseudonocardia sp. KRD291 TaxID=2792007 RepID=UPI001C4A2B5D|nr:NYN domain-containing protein [Pseudonocardia sp. KRD291]MBW0105601.1 NYN domain-containing protein [Pseudonocardia sp. KRD291]